MTQNPPPGHEDDLSNKEKQQIEDELGIEADLSASDAYLLLRVPDFGEPDFPNTEAALFPEQQHDSSNRKLTSFLRLGAFDIDDEPESAKKLLKLIHQAGPPGNPARGNNQSPFYVPGSGSSTEAFDSDKHGFLDVPPLQPRDEGADNKASAAGNRDVFFVDDVRVRPQDVTGLTTDDPGHGLTMSLRQAESARLYSRGGWRDHSDGNRISTTYGDKVEVVRGNYKMIVMGRQDDPGEAMGWENTGSHIQDYAPGTMPGASYWLEWIPNYEIQQFEADNKAKKDPTTKEPPVFGKGVWLLANTTENVYEYARNAGHFREEKWGDLHESYVGSSNPPLDNPLITDVTKPKGQGGTDTTHGTGGHDVSADIRVDGINYDLPATLAKDRAQPSWTHDNTGKVRSNPHIIERKWARRIDSSTGSFDCPVPTIVEDKFANTIKETTGSAGCRASITATTYASSITEETHCSGALWSMTNATALNERKHVGFLADTTVTGPMAETLVAGARLSTAVAVAIHVDIEWATIKVAVSAGIHHFACQIGTSFELKLGWHEDYKWPKKKEVTAKDVKQSLERVEQTVKTNRQILNWQQKTGMWDLKAFKASIG